MQARQKPDRIALKDDIPSSERTPGRDEAAEYIQEEVIEKDRWPMDLTEIADEAGWSRQHIKNTLDAYFREVDNGTEESVVETSDDTPRTITKRVSGRKVQDEIARDVIYLEIPEDVNDPEDYVRGWFAGRLRAYESEELFE